MSFEIRPFARSDASRLRAFWEIGKASAGEGPHDIWPAWELARRAWSVPDTESEHVFLGAFEDEVMLGGARLAMTLGHNTHLTQVELNVAPTERRRGVGTALVKAVESRAVAAGRTTVLGEAVLPPAGSGSGVSFAMARGYTRVSADEFKVVELAASGADLPRLAAMAAERSGDYQLRWWRDVAPEDLIEEFAVLRTAFVEEIPREGSDMAGHTWTAEQLRARAARLAAEGRHTVTVVACAPGGGLAGYSESFVADGEPERAEIGGTVVLRGHRGHRLGLAIKVRLHELVAEQWPEVRTIMTFNAGVNAHMNDINEELGYRVVANLVGLQKRL